jgi:DNA polymerase-3 subunit beta
MRFTCDKSALCDVLPNVAKAASAKTPMEALAAIRLSASEQHLELTGYDLELGIRTEIPAAVDEPGVLLVDSRLFSEIVRKMPEDDVTIEVRENLQTTISCGKSVFRIVGKDATEFSPLPSVDRKDPVTLTQFQLREMIRQTIFSISPNDANKIMTGEFVQIRENEMRIVGLDGHRIAIRRLLLNMAYDAREVIIPGKTMNEIGKILTGEMEDEVRLYFTRNHVLFEMDQTTVVSRLIDGNYFRVDQMLSNDFETKIIVKKSGTPRYCKEKLD